MKVIYYRSPRGNFGDDLNAVMWPELLPPACFADDDAVLLGIGSIFRDDYLSPAATARKRVFVLGSGAGTGPLPSRWPNEDWSILAVRGPLTAKLIGLPEAAITDSAALLSTLPRMISRSEGPGGIVFMPHYNSVLHSRWAEICDMAGIDFVDAHWPVEKVIRRLRGARLVVAEAMHGAIVADTLRVPWVPVISSPAILPFKWVDWTRSLDLPYRPHALPPSSAWEALKHMKIRAVDGETGLAGLSEDDQDILDDFHRRYGAVSADDLAPKKVIDGAKAKKARKVTAMFDRLFSERAARALVAATQSRPYLSEDRVFAERVGRLQGAVAQLHRALAGTMH